MLRFFRRVSKSKIGTWIVAIVVLGIMGGFAIGDISNFGSGNIGFGGLGSSTLAKVGDQEVSERDMSDAMQRRLQQVRQEKPDADYASITADFEPLLADLIDQRSLLAFADKYGFHLSKALIDAEITQIPGTKGLNGKFSDQQYQAFLAQQHLTDAGVRDIITTGLLQKLLLTPIATNSRVPLGMATPYASMMLEAREGDAGVVPLDPFKAGLKPTDAQIQQFYSANRSRYMIPEQRVLRLAVIGPEQVASVSASDKEIADYYNAHHADYAAKETRTLSQAVVPDQNTANAIAVRAKGGASIADAAKPAGANAAVTSLTDETRDAYAGVAGAKVAAAVFAAPSGAVVGPVQSDFGWVVVKVDSVKSAGGKTLAQAHDEIAAKLNGDKRKGALDDLINQVQDSLDAGNNFGEAVAKAKLTITTTPLITAAGVARGDANYKFPENIAPALKTGFDMAQNDQPEVVSLPNDQGAVMVSPAQVVPAAPAPLASIHDQVATDWINDQAFQRARSAATAIAAKASGGMALDQAMKTAGVALPPIRPLAARRIQLAQAGGQIPAPLKLLFTLAQGKSQAVADPQGRGFFIVKVSKIIPGNATLQPTLIAQMRNELQQSVSADYAREFMAAVREDMKVKRNVSAIAAEKARISSSGG